MLSVAGLNPDIKIEPKVCPLFEFAKKSILSWQGNLVCVGTEIQVVLAEKSPAQGCGAVPTWIRTRTS